MKRVIVLATSVLIASVAVAQTLPEAIRKNNANSKIELSHSFDNGVESKCETTEGIMAKTPEWNGTSEPPLPLSKAVSMGSEYLRKKHSEFTQFKLNGVWLQSADGFTLTNHWCYNLDFIATTHVGDTSAHAFMTVVLLLDGTVVEPRVIK